VTSILMARWRTKFAVRPSPDKVKVSTWLCTVIAFCLLSLRPAVGGAADATTLSGIEGFRIEIEKVSKAARNLGLDEVRLQVLARERLQRAALPIGDFPAVLTVSLHTIEHPTTVLAYCLEVKIRQVMHLSRTS